MQGVSTWPVDRSVTADMLRFNVIIPVQIVRPDHRARRVVPVRGLSDRRPCLERFERSLLGDDFRTLRSGSRDLPPLLLQLSWRRGACIRAGALVWTDPLQSARLPGQGPIRVGRRASVYRPASEVCLRSERRCRAEIARHFMRLPRQRGRSGRLLPRRLYHQPRRNCRSFSCSIH